MEAQSEFGHCSCDCFEDDGALQKYCHKEKFEGGEDPDRFTESYTFYAGTGVCYKLFSQVRGETKIFNGTYLSEIYL